MCVLITYNENLSFGGTFDPAFSLKIVGFCSLVRLLSGLISLVLGLRGSNLG